MTEPILRPNRKRRPLTEEQIAFYLLLSSPRHRFQKRCPDFAYIYAITDGEFVKFGQTWDVSKRLRSLQTSSPKKLSLLKSCLLPKQFEGGIHDHLKPHRRSGEWFDLNDASKAVIELMHVDHFEKLYALVWPE